MDFFLLQTVRQLHINPIMNNHISINLLIPEIIKNHIG